MLYEFSPGYNCLTNGHSTPKEDRQDEWEWICHLLWAVGIFCHGRMGHLGVLSLPTPTPTPPRATTGDREKMERGSAGHSWECRGQSRETAVPTPAPISHHNCFCDPLPHPAFVHFRLTDSSAFGQFEGKQNTSDAENQKIKTPGNTQRVRQQPCGEK